MNTTNNIRVLVLMSTYNGEQFLHEQLDSILNQKNVEATLLIRDDGSIDTSKEIIKKYIQKFPDRIILVESDNIGFARSFSELLRIAYMNYNEFRYFAFADQDDVWEAHKLYSAVSLLKNLSDDNLPVTYCSNTALVDRNLKFLKYAWGNRDVTITKPMAMVQSYATGCTMVFNKKAVELYVTHIPKQVSRHDFLMYQICAFLGKVIYDKNSYIKYRQHGNNQIGRPSFGKRMKIRMQGRYKEHVLEKQNRLFLDAYKDLLSIDDIELLSRVAFYRKSLFTKFALLLDHRIKFDSFEANFFFILKILLGYV